MLSADIPDQISNLGRDFPVQRRPSVLRDPHQTQVDLKDSVRAPPVFPIPEVYPARKR